MAKAFLITEKPSVMNDIKRVYTANKNKIKLPYGITDIDFGCCAGHLIGLCEPDEYSDMDWGRPWKKEALPIIPKKWKKKVINPKFYKKLKEQYDSNNYDYIINAGDAGREGQLIQLLTYEQMGVKIPVLRFWSDDTVDSSIIKALENLKSDEEYKGLSYASLLRLFYDWLVGINFSRASSLSLGRRGIIGRVQTPVLKMICDREDEITNFKPVKYFELEATFRTVDAKNYVGILINKKAEANLSSYAFLNRGYLEKVKQEIQGKDGNIKDIKEEDKKTLAPALFNLTDLQKECSKKFKYHPKKTLDIAESLYMKKFLSYPRTESKCITTALAKDIPNLVEKLVDKLDGNDGIAKLPTEEIKKHLNKANYDKVLKSKKYVDDKKVHDHPALTPTKEIPKLSDLTSEELNVYMLVVKRLLAIFMPEYIVSQTTVITEVQGERPYLFKTVDSVIKQLGWKEIYKYDKFKDTVKEEPKSDFPELHPNIPVSVEKAKVNAKETTPPKRYTDETILTAMETAGKKLDDEELEKVLMECAGLGTPATRAEIITKLETYNYITHDKTAIVPTTEGKELIKALGKSVVTSPSLTATWEKYLKQVEREEMSYETYYQNMIKFINQYTEYFLNLEYIGPFNDVIGKCPVCKERDFIDFSKVYTCTGFFQKDTEGNPLCRFCIPKNFGVNKITRADVVSLLSGNSTSEKRFETNGKKITRKLVLDWVDNQETGEKEYKLTFPKKNQNNYEEVAKCPLCGGRIFKGKGYFCENWTKKGENTDHLCSFILGAKVGEATVTPKMFKEMLEQGETSKAYIVPLKDGKEITGKLYIDYEKHWISVKKFEEREIMKCPICEDGVIIEEQYYYRCSNLRDKCGCNFQIPKKYISARISVKDLKNLIPIGKTVRKPLTSSKGNTWESDIRIVVDEEKGIILSYK